MRKKLFGQLVAKIKKQAITLEAVAKILKDEKKDCFSGSLNHWSYVTSVMDDGGPANSVSGGDWDNWNFGDAIPKNNREGQKIYGITRYLFIGESRQEIGNFLAANIHEYISEDDYAAGKRRGYLDIEVFNRYGTKQCVWCGQEYSGTPVYPCWFCGGN